MSGAPERVGVIGGGRMGAGIAQVFAQAGSEVTVIERDDDAAVAAQSRLADGIAKAAARNPSVDLESTLARVRVSTSYDDLAPAGLIVEAVPEVIELKIEALTRAERVVSPTAWVATNTSSLPVTRLAEELTHPDRFCGLHFFNPVPPSALVEIVLTPRASSALRDAALGWVESLGKAAIVVNDSPGFASSRLGNVLALEAMRMLEEGVAEAADIDAAMVLGYRHATGPLRTSDLVGLDVRLNICEFLHESLGERFAPPQILRDKVAAGDLGRKTGRGFFDYS
ncbi:3-hydroxyacyl-CoA dehydrogenase family protein [Rathayibacter sp. VKM Ac-2929]|uniref:3-hydroxyacyl-CoA dehydrogenase family protein n=1 Tax=Rathayibacter sp. VKM Ac-2929 TaxID=2929480 RepID=UPI001FB2E8FD|nr:3-hydroxyacyl-CoA dehydrogenase family protein [Rathayibacter sp. VKM Ac-2929]MCJ1675504.1 3-hydroxyacyl-CoA dehydrogenase family protein [Rathayibacter sp. VKM Ac-2929]